MAETFAGIVWVLLLLIFGTAIIGYIAPEVFVGVGFVAGWSDGTWAIVGGVALVISSLIAN